jgi:hypothetical protein
MRGGLTLAFTPESRPTVPTGTTIVFHTPVHLVTMLETSRQTSSGEHTQRERESMKTLRVSLLAFVATGALLSGGALQVRTVAADTPAMRPVIGGQYCHELSKGEAFVASQTPSNSLYCDPASGQTFGQPVFDPTLDPNWRPPADTTGAEG